MDLEGRPESSNVEDRRGMGPILVGGGGLGSVVLAIVFYLLSGRSGIEGQAPSAQPAPPGESRSRAAPDRDPQSHLVSIVLADTEQAWHKIFRQRYRSEYVEPKLVLFTDVVRSGCGLGEAAMGPFYCPRDSKVYIDLGFYRELRDRFGAPGDFAQAYVIAHEVGHHVQNLRGISDRVEAQRASHPGSGNALSVRLELQADCLAGVWGHDADSARHLLQAGDVEEALNAASAIGDDRLQRQTRGRVAPDSFTHGSSAQRVQWFKRGFASGDPDRCDTFGTGTLAAR